MFNIPTGEARFSNGNARSRPLVRPWSFNIEEVHFVYRMGTTASDIIKIALEVKNYEATAFANSHTDFKITHDLTFIGSDEEFASLSGDIAEAPTGALNFENLDTIFIDLRLINTGLFQPGQYGGSVNFYVTAVNNATTLPEVIERLELPLLLSVMSPSSLLTQNVEDYYFTHVAGEPLPPSQGLVFNQGLWVIAVPEALTLVGLDSNIVSEGAGFINYQIGFLDTTTIQIGLTLGVESQSQPTVQYEVFFRNLGSTEIFSFLVNVFLEIDLSLVISPVSITWTVIKGITTTPQGLITATGSGTYGAIAPDFVVIPTFIQQGFTLNVPVSPIGVDNLAAGTYSGNVVVLEDGEPAGAVPITLIVIDRVNDPYTDAGINFSKDLQYISFYNALENVFLEATYTIRTSLYNNGVEVPAVELKETYPFFKNIAQVHLGEIADRFFENPEELSFLDGATNEILGAYYRPLLMDVTFKVIRRDFGFVLFTYTRTSRMWISGRTPELSVPTAGLLSHKMRPRRITVNSKILFSYLQLNANFGVQVERNGTIIDTINGQIPGTALALFKYNAINLTPGDRLKIFTRSFDLTDLTEHAQEYIVLPEGKHSNHILWLNEYLVIDQFECTGDFRFTTDHNSITARRYRNLVEIVDKLDPRQENKLTINTGWVLKADQYVINDMMRAFKAWVQVEDTYYELVPEDIDLVNEDSDQKLYSYDLTFLINKSHELENNTSIL